MDNRTLKRKEANMNLDSLNWYHIVFTCLAIVGSAYFASIKYFRGHLYKAKIEPSISFTTDVVDGIDRINITVCIVNNSDYSVPVPEDGFPMIVSTSSESRDQDGSIHTTWTDFAKIRLFKKNNAVLAGETVRSPYLFEVPHGEHQKLKLEFMANYSGHKILGNLIKDEGTSWAEEVFVLLK